MEINRIKRTKPTPTAEQMELGEKVHQRLLAFFGRPDWGNPVPPLDELISTILSQNTNDRNRDAAYESLRKRFPTWEAVRDVDAQDVVEAIRTAGLANIKGPRIQAVLRKISNEYGSLDLEFLRQMPPKEVREWLLHIDGVGPKTAAIVMQFSLGMCAFPVDTHIYRVSGRLGLRPAEMDVVRAHEHLSVLFSPTNYGVDHLNLIRLGRELCSPRNPNCLACPLRDICEYNNKHSTVSG